jgi:hypothetical protein
MLNSCSYELRHILGAGDYICLTHTAIPKRLIMIMIMTMVMMIINTTATTTAAAIATAVICHNVVCVCVRRGGAGDRGGIFSNSPEHQRCLEVITAYRPASAGNSHPVSPLLFNLAYFMEESKSTNPLTPGRF